MIDSRKRGMIHGLKTASIIGIATGTLHLMKDLMPSGIVRRTLVYWDLLAPLSLDQSPSDNPTEAKSNRTPETGTPWWDALIPFRVISEEEAKKRKALEAELLEQQLQMMDPPQKRTLELQQMLKRKMQDSKDS
eukprot:g974.t1